jgi:hypothetical protein
VVAAEELRHFDLLGHAVLADPLEEVVLRHLAAWRQGAATASIWLRNAISSASSLLRALRYSALSLGKVRWVITIPCCIGSGWRTPGNREDGHGQFY